METDRLRYFCAIVDTGSLTKAAEILGVSHSGLSKAMMVLQDELGYKVFVPKGRGLELNEAGKSLYQQSRKILEMVGSLKTPTLFPSEAVRIGFPEVLILTVAEIITTQFPHGLVLEDLDSGEIEHRVLEGKNDFAFTFIPFPNKDLEYLKVASVTLSSYAKMGAFKGQAPERIPYVIPVSEIKDNPLSIKIRDGWNMDLERTTPYRANSLSIALQMAQSGQCAVYTPRFLIEHLNALAPKNRQLAELELPAHRRSQERSTRDIFLIKRARDEESKTMKAVAKIVRHACRV